MNVNGSCHGLFIDNNNTLYCSLYDFHKIVKGALTTGVTTPMTTAGNGTSGLTADMLNNPWGIFVDENFTLYVADTNNHRIQCFKLGELNATTVAGSTAPVNFSLNSPAGVVLDADGYLFIMDTDNFRIVGSSSAGFRCLVGCSMVQGSAADQLNHARYLAFDVYGDMLVTDDDNHRIQKFTLVSNACYDPTTATPTNTQIANEQITSTKQQSSVITTSKSFISNPSCYSPTVTLIPGISSLSFPIQFRRSQEFYIVSTIELNCNESLSISTLWTINNCSLINCSHQIHLDENIVTTYSELYIPAKTLGYGIFELKLIVTMVNFPSLTTSSSIYVRIIPSSFKANLVYLGTSMITNGHDEELKLDPGTFSIDPDENVFNANNWKYEYYCRIYDIYMFPNLNGSLLSIDDLGIDPVNPSCLLNQTALKYNGVIPSPKSSLTILAGSLQSNRTYQFMVYMENRLNSSLQATSYVLVRIEDTYSPLIVIGCVIWTICVPNMEYQLVNPTTQVALYALCIGNCTKIQNIKWNIYQGIINSSSNITEWNLFNQMVSYENIWFFGTNTSNFTASNKLFLANSQITLWRFEVNYIFASATSLSVLHFMINQPPSNGSCSIDPLNGTTTTLFDISCSDWFDDDEIKDYSLYSWTTNPSNRMIIAYSSVSTFQVRLPAGNDQTSVLHLIVNIRDTFDCFIELNISSVNVFPDSVALSDLINNLERLSNPIVQLLASENQNIVGQIITSLCQEFNKMNNENLNTAFSNGIPAASISVSSLRSQNVQGMTSMPLNFSALVEYNKELNSLADVREYLTTFTTNLAITTLNSIELQSSSLVQLTKSTNQLTRTALTIALDRCYQLSVALYSMSTRISYEDVQTSATQLIQCSTNILTAVNGPLQKRTNVLDLDSSRATAFPDDYDTDIESEWSNLNLFADGNDFSWETIEKNRNLYNQKQLSNQITTQVNKIMSLLTAALNIHLNIGQDLTINTSEVFMSVETNTINSLSNKQIKQIGNGQISLPTNFNSSLNQNSTVSIRSKMEPLAPYGNSKSSSNTNLSTSVSLSILDQNGNEVSIQSNMSNPIEIMIPRDPNIIISPMILQNVTSNLHNQVFNLNYINITSTLAVSIHFEIRPLNTSLVYLFIYRFDSAPQLNSSMNQIDGWKLFCPSNLTNESIYTYFLNNQQKSDYQSLIYGLRELNSTEMLDVCSNISMNSPPITNERFNFTSNYELRVYTSGCYYLDSNNQWQSDGLIVGPLTNHYQTQCYSTHLTTFAGGFNVLPSPINWNYVLANGEFIRNKAIATRYTDKRHVENLTAACFFEDIMSQELETMEKFHFICQKWLAIEEGDEHIERVLPMANEMEKRDFSFIKIKHFM